MLQYRHSSPTWPSLPPLPSLLPLSFLGIHQYSCSFPRGPMGHGYTFTQAHTAILDSTLQAWTSRPICDSASYRWELWQFGEVVKCHADTHEERNLNEEENELLVAHWKLANSYCITRCVICKNKLQGTLVDGLEIR